MTPTEAPVHEFLNSRLQTGQLKEQAQRLLTSKNFLRVVEQLTPKDLGRLIDKFHEVYLTVDAQDKEFLTLFGGFCSATKRFPASVVLSDGLVKHGSIPRASGGLMDVWQGNHNGTQVAIKAFRACPVQNLEEAKKIVRRLAPKWKKLTHTNIAPFRGVNTELFRLALVYDWGKNGNIIQYLESHPETSRLTLLHQVAEGLRYLHSFDIPHGDLKGANVLIDRSGKALLTDYGLAPINSNPDLTIASPTLENSRWLAPEITNPPHDIESKRADIFAFGMLAIEVFTGKLPFEEHSGSETAYRIWRGERPGFPQNADDSGLNIEMRELLQSCWHRDPMRRPTADAVVRTLEDLIKNNEHMERASSDQNYGELVPDVDDLLSGPQPTLQSTGVGGQPTQPDTPSAKKWWRKLLCGLSLYGC